MNTNLKNRVGLILGVTGQDGSYLAEFLLEKGYIVHGIKRRSSLFNTDRIDHLYKERKDANNFFLHYGDLTDSTNLIRIIQEVQPDEIYNLAAQSHVKVSFETPEYTANADAIGTLRILEAIRILGLENKCKYYQASSSEMFGLVQEIPQKETTPFYPRSPYGVAKLYAHWITVNYRESYGMFACSGILFNHETVAAFMPMIFKNESGQIDIKPISEIVKYELNDWTSIDEKRKEYQETTVSKNLLVWDNNDWTKIKFASAYPHKGDKNPRYVISKNSAVMATDEHVCIMDDKSEKKFSDLEKGDKVNLIEYPSFEEVDFSINEKEAELMGFIVGDGHIGGNRIRLTQKDKNKLEYYEKIWLELNENNNIRYSTVQSGFKEESIITQMNMNNCKWFLDKVGRDFYDEFKCKRVPKKILNSNTEIQRAFLVGYNDSDGLKKNKTIYQFKNFRTNSATLASGLLFLIKRVTGQEYNINVEYLFKHKKWRNYYSINLLSDSDKSLRKSVEKYEKVLEMLKDRRTKISRVFIRNVKRGYVPDAKSHLLKENNVVKKIIEMPEYEGWFYDITTESGTFHCGVGQGHVHNSPVRGETFVTRKITRGVAKIHHGLQEKIYLGNLDAERDWGHAKDYCIDLETKVLTTNGFKSRDEISIDDTLINYNTDLNIWQYDTIEKIYDVEHKGKMFNFRGNGFSFRCSPNHKLYYQHKSHKSKNWSKNKSITAENFYELINDLKLRSKYDYRLIGIQKLDVVDDYEIEDDMIKLMGFLISEGNLSKSKNIGGGMQLSVSQSYKKYYDDLKNCIDNLNLSYSEKNRKDGVNQFIFRSESRDRILEYFDRNDIHHVPNIVYKFSTRQLEILFDSLMCGDGCWSSLIYTSTRYDIVDKLQDICAMIGFKSKIQKRKSGVYNLTIHSHAKKSTFNYITECDVENYVEENIWCLETKNNGTLITKKEGEGIFSSGNCKGMWLMLQQDKPDDYILATNRKISVRKFVEMSFDNIGIQIIWEGEGVNEKGIDLETGRVLVEIDPEYFRPSEVDLLIGDYTKAKTILGWEPTYTVEELCKEMMESDLELFKKEKYLKEGGYEIKEYFE